MKNVYREIKLKKKQLNKETLKILKLKNDSSKNLKNDWSNWKTIHEP